MKYWQKLSKRIDTKKLSLIQKFVLLHAEPVNFIIHIIAAIILMYGLWINNLNYVFVSIFFVMIGHLYANLKK